MTKSLKSEKLVEIHEFCVIRTPSGALPALCAECSTSDSILLTPEQAAAVAQIPVRVIYQWVELGAVHYQEGRDRSLTVCLKSLTAAAERGLES